MKNTIKIVVSTVLILVTLLVGCQKFERAQIEITNCHADGKVMTGSARITDDGGCPYFIEQGYCYSLFDTVSAAEVYTTMVPVIYSTDATEFSWQSILPLADTVYYVRAYVKTNAGIAYSSVQSVNTTTNTFK